VKVLLGFKRLREVIRWQTKTVSTESYLVSLRNAAMFTKFYVLNYFSLVAINILFAESSMILRKFISFWLFDDAVSSSDCVESNGRRIYV
jgi:hypothetical protein